MENLCDFATLPYPIYFRSKFDFTAMPCGCLDSERSLRKWIIKMKDALTILKVNLLCFSPISQQSARSALALISNSKKSKKRTLTQMYYCPGAFPLLTSTLSANLAYLKVFRQLANTKLFFCTLSRLLSSYLSISRSISVTVLNFTAWAPSYRTVTTSLFIFYY